VTLADQFALLVANSVPQIRPQPQILNDTENNTQKSRTVYSIGEAVSYRGTNKNAKLGASPF
jgi:hypothetical protein